MGSHISYESLISLRAIHSAWAEFKRGKERKADVQEFAYSLEEHLLDLHRELRSCRYRHGPYAAFCIRDPKPRSIHKALVRDRVLHHAITTAITPFFEKSFIFDSYSSREDKGTHAAVRRLSRFIWRLSVNNTRRVWVLKCDITKFFDSVNHGVLLKILFDAIEDRRIRDLLTIIVQSFNGHNGKGIPLGNVTSQLFSNVYLNELDQFMKRDAKTRCYVRYADDFAIVSRDRNELEDLIPSVRKFLMERLRLDLHQRKVILRPASQGIDFLGYIVFPHHMVIRTRTKRRIIRRLIEAKELYRNGVIPLARYEGVLQSYRGVLSHCRAYRLLKYINATFGDKAIVAINNKSPLA